MSRLEESIEIANPQHPHCATVLVIDTSGSMQVNGKIKQLADGLQFFKDDVIADELASKRVDLAIITFGQDVTVAHDFSSMDAFDPPALQAAGLTPMGEAVLRAIDLIEERKREYRRRGIDYYRPWIFLITDGEPTDMDPGDATWNKVVASINDGENNKNFLFFTVGVEPADMDVLKQLSPANREPVRLMPGKFKAMFEWLSKSQGKVSASKVGENVQLDSLSGWAEISTV